MSAWWTVRRHLKPHHLPPLLQQLVGELSAHFGAELRAVVLYGSAASDEFLPAKSNVNLLVVTARHDPARWPQLRTLAAGWRKRRLDVPLFFSEQELSDWAHSFPIEFLDIQANHRMLFGDERIVQWPIDLARLQWQCENELRGKLLRLRQVFVAQPDRATTRMILERSLTSCLPVFRALIRLKGQTAPLKKSALIAALAEAYHLPADAFHALLALKTGRSRPSRRQLTDLFERYLVALQQLAAALDSTSRSSRA